MLLIRLAFRLLIREWRAGELYILLAALILAMACVASVDFATDRMQQAIEHQGAELLGGDIAVTSPKPMPESWSVYAKQLGLNTSISLEFASMLNAGEQYQLATVKAVDDNYPLLGVLEARTAFTAPANKMLRGPQPGEAWLEPRLWSTLQLKLNRLVTIGATALTASHVLAYEPDYSISWLNIAPRVLINHADLAKTRVLQPGSRAEYRLLVVGNSAALNRFILWLKPQLSASQKVINSKTGQTRLRNTLEQIEQYLKLASLICITLAGIAIATAIHHYTKRHYDTSSLLRCFGLKQRQIVGVYGYQLVILGFIGTLIGCLVGFLGQIILAKWVNASLQLILPAPHRLEPIDSTGVQVQPQQQNGISYLSGGIGEDEAKAIQQATGYNLHMTFSIGVENKYIPDVDVVIQKAEGQTVLTLSQAGPLVYVQLPPGKYTVVATRNGEAKHDTADVGSGTARNLVFHWGGEN